MSLGPSTGMANEEARRLLGGGDIHELGRRADDLKRHLWGDRVFYSSYLNLNYTNICRLQCPLCAFAREEGSPGAFRLNSRDIEERIAWALREGELREVHVVGGIDERFGLREAVHLLMTIRRSAPGVFIKAFSAVEIHELARREGCSHGDILLRLKEAGLDGMPGGGAEIFSERVRKIIAPRKIDGATWCEVHEAAHHLGLTTNATMLFGHLETDEEIVEHLTALRKLQDKTRGFKAFIPLVFHPENTAMRELSRVDGLKILRVFAVSRLFLNDIPHIKAHWPSLGAKLAQVLLSYGVDDLGGTAMDEKVFREAGGSSAEMDGEALASLIRETGRIPVLSASDYLAVGARS